MGIFDFFKQATKKRHLDEYDHEENLEALVNAVPEKLAASGVTDDSEKEIQYTFSTNDAKNADALIGKLSPLGYSPETKASEENPEIIIITGKTKSMKMEKDKVTMWIRDMCILGFSEDCKFEGWEI